MVGGIPGWSLGGGDRAQEADVGGGRSLLLVLAIEGRRRRDRRREMM